MKLLNYGKPLALLTLTLLSIRQVQAECELIFPASTPSGDFEIHNNGTVTHKKTKLMWKVCPEGSDWDNGTTCTDGDAGYTWQESLQHVSGLNSSGGFAGYSDWRLPNIKELLSIVEDQCHLTAINVDIFNAGALELYYGVFWSSTPSIRNSGYGLDSAYFIDFRSGSSSSFTRENTAQIRLVRTAE